MNQLAKAPAWLFYMAFFSSHHSYAKWSFENAVMISPKKLWTFLKTVYEVIVTPALLGFQISVLLIFVFLSVTKICIIQD